MFTVSPEAIGPWTRQTPQMPPPQEKELWKQKEDVASAWAVCAVTAAAILLLFVLAILG